MPAQEVDGRFVRPVDSLLDEIFHLYVNRDEAIRMIGRLVLKHPELDTGLTAVVMRLACEHRDPEPIAYGSQGEPLYAHQIPQE